MASTALRTTQFVGLTSSLVVSGINFGAGHITVPVLYRLPGGMSADIFRDFYHRGAFTVVPVAILSTISSATAAYLSGPRGNGRLLWAGVAAATIMTQVWTLVFMMGTNNKLLRISAIEGTEKREEEAKKEDVEGLLKKWRLLNNIRAGFAATGGLLGAWAVVFA